MSKNYYKIFVLIFSICFIFAPLSPAGIISHAFDYSDGNVISGYQEWDEDVKIEGEVTIASGAILIIKEGVKVTFKKQGQLIVEGKLFVKGTKNNQVKFRREGIEEAAEDPMIGYAGYAVTVLGEAYFRNADISGGGELYFEVLNNKTILNRAFAGPFFSGSVQVFNEGKLTMDECNIHGNVVGLVLGVTNNQNIRVNKNFFERNIRYDVYNGSYPQNQSQIDFRYNWWGSASGPEKNNDPYLQQEYALIAGDVDLSSWLISKDFKDPVIIIPGIMGSAKKDGEWEIDPYLHIFDNLYEELINNGYVPEKDLFTLPYEWRNSNIENAKLLKEKIADIKIKNNWPKVDLVVHSMGGLLARAYIESDYYNDDIDQLIMMGTPNNGAPIAYLKWEAGAFLTDFQEIFMKYYFNHEAKENGHTDVFHYIQEKPIASIKELLPTYGYLYDVEKDNVLRDYPNNYPVNDFLENLNSQKNKEKLLRVESNKIIGNINSSISTTIGFEVINANMGEYWIDGYPHGFEIPIGNRGIRFGNGDRTVPLESAKSGNIFSDNLIELNSSHTALPTEAQKDVVEILTGNRPENEVRHNLIKDILFVSVFSPIDIQVEAPDGKKIGKDFATGEIINEIEGAYYTGSGAESEFLTIPNPIDGEYKILTEGTETGEYKVEATKITEDIETGVASESMAIIEGSAILGQKEEKEINVEGNKVTAENQDIISPEISIVSPEGNKTYQNNQIIPVDYQVADNQSLVEKIQSQTILDGVNLTENKIDLSLQNLEEHKFKITAVDEAENVQEKEIAFKIETSIASIKDNVNHFTVLGLIKKQDKNILLASLNVIQTLQEIIEKFKENKFLPKKTKERTINLFKNRINWHLDWLAEYVKQRSRLKIKNGIAPRAGSLLIESLRFVRII